MLQANDEQFTINNLGLKKYLIYSLVDIIPVAQNQYF